MNETYNFRTSKEGRVIRMTEWNTWQHYRSANGDIRILPTARSYVKARIYYSRPGVLVRHYVGLVKLVRNVSLF